VRSPFQRPIRLLIAIPLVLLLAAAVIIGAVLWWSLPSTRQTAAIPGLSAPVEIGFDQDGVPRIHAASALDAAAALGFVHARDRMFQMDLMRRNASGRLSEIAGPVTLRLDRSMRVLGLRRRAEADLAGLPAETRAMLDAYARGVNAWITARGRFAAPEFLLFGAPEPWMPVDSLLWGKTMGLWLSGNWHTELARLSLAGKVPQRIIAELWPPDIAGGRRAAALMPDRRFAEAAGRLTTSLPHFPDPFTQPDSASNEWAVDGRHSATGAPLLAGDPHLALGLPGIWYLARIETPEGVLAGATGPGVPFLVLGHNGHIAWTFTTTGADVQDVFIETQTTDGTGYLTPDGPRPFAVRQERIKVRGGPDEVLTVRETRHGPVISDLGNGDGAVLAVSMGNLAPGDTAAAGLFALNQAHDIAEAGLAAGRISAPAQNLLVADRARIAVYVTGRVPVRRAGDGRAPVEGADGTYDWTGLAGGAQLPRVVSPASGRLVNANERIAPPGFPIFMGRDWFGDWRARRIHDMLEATDRHTVEGFVRMQTDIKSAFAAELLPTLLAVQPPPGPDARAHALLEGWDGSMRMDLPQPLIFNAWIARFHALLLQRNAIPEASAGPMAETVAFALSADGAHWCGDDCTGLLRRSLSEAVRALSAQFGDDPAAWRWSRAHRAVFAHPVLRAIPILGPLTTARIDAPGDDSTVDRQGNRGGAFDSVHGASYRGVYDLADLDRSRFVIAPGQSGNPLSRHNRDFLLRWRDGETVMLGPNPGKVTATIRLIP
jgi:penicillin amidase